jgi:hypothetical protein
MLTRSLTMLCLSLMRVSGWQMAALPVPHGHAQCASSQTSARQAVAPQMCSYDRLSSEFQRLANQRTGTVFGEPRSLLRQHKADSAWVLLFNAGQRNEGVYTLQGRETPEKSHGTYVLAFEQHEEACRFGMMLQAQGFDLATATKWTSELLGDFCDTADFSLGFVPDAALLIPPAQNFFVEHHELVEPPQSNSAAGAFATVPETSGNAEEAEAWGCSGPDGAELCANLENLFNLD